MTRLFAAMLAFGLVLTPAVASACKAPDTTVQFEPGTSRIVGSQGLSLEDFILYATTPDTTEVHLSASASERGDALARARAAIVIERLTAVGIPRERITVETRSFDWNGPDTGLGVDLMRLPYQRVMDDSQSPPPCGRSYPPSLSPPSILNLPETHTDD